MLHGWSCPVCCLCPATECQILTMTLFCTQKFLKSLFLSLRQVQEWLIWRVLGLLKRLQGNFARAEVWLRICISHSIDSDLWLKLILQVNILLLFNSIQISRLYGFWQDAKIFPEYPCQRLIIHVLKMSYKEK